MSKRQRAAYRDDQPPTADTGPDSRWKARLPEGRGASPLLVIGQGGTAEIILPTKRRAQHRSDAETAELHATIAQIERFQP